MARDRLAAREGVPRNKISEKKKMMDLAFCITVGDHPILALYFHLGVCNLSKIHNFKYIIVGDAVSNFCFLSVVGCGYQIRSDPTDWWGQAVSIQVRTRAERNHSS